MRANTALASSHASARERESGGGRRVTANENALTTPAQWVKSEALLPETVFDAPARRGVVTRCARACIVLRAPPLKRHKTQRPFEMLLSDAAFCRDLSFLPVLAG
ncbi:hypothetical protein MTO96_002100 [Rhipicephalus appendiculatus]